MFIIKTQLIILSFLIILGCNNSPNKSVSTQKSSTKEQKPEPAEDEIKPNLDLTKYGVDNDPRNILGGLKVGDKAPDFKMKDQDGNEVSLESSLSEGPVLVVFLRAEWCSYCVRHLQEFQDNIQDIHNAGQVKVLAISPQEKSYMQKFHGERDFSFPILNDKDHSVMKDYKVFFHVTEKYNSYIEKAKGKKIEEFNGNTEPVMPIPATYLIGQDQIIKYVHYDPDYKKRSNVKEVINTI